MYKVDMLVYPGDAPQQEDGFYMEAGPAVRYFRGEGKKKCQYATKLDNLRGDPCFLVIDAYSGVYHPRNGPAMFGKHSTGQAVTRSIISTFFRSTNLSPPQRLQLANQRLRRLAEIATAQNGPDDAGILPGASYVLAYAENGLLHIVHGGECFAVWKFCDGTQGVTVNQVLEHDARLLELQEKLRSEARSAGLTGLDETYYIWDALVLATIQAQRKDVNAGGGYSIINGQNFLPYAVHTRLPLNKLKRLVLATDGLVKYQEFLDPARMAQGIIAEAEKSGLSGIIKKTQSMNATGFSSNAEAVALDIEFINNYS